MGVVKVNVDGLTSPDLILFLQHAGLSQAEFLQTKSAELIIQYKAFLLHYKKVVPLASSITTKISKFKSNVKALSTVGTSPRASASVIAEGDSVIAEGDTFGGLSSELHRIHKDYSVDGFVLYVSSFLPSCDRMH